MILMIVSELVDERLASVVIRNIIREAFVFQILTIIAISTA